MLKIRFYSDSDDAFYIVITKFFEFKLKKKMFLQKNINIVMYLILIFIILLKYIQTNSSNNLLMSGGFIWPGGANMGVLLIKR